MNDKKGFVLVEILIALAILSMILISIISGVTSSIQAISGLKNYTQAMIIARSQMNDFMVKNMRGADVRREPVTDTPGFTYSRLTKRFEFPLLGPVPANQTSIIVSWLENGSKRSYKISFIYQQL